MQEQGRLIKKTGQKTKSRSENKLKKALLISLSISLAAACLFAGCVKSTTASAPAESEKATEKTTVTTTENTQTTFQSVGVTREIYDALERNDGAGFDYLLAEYTTYYSTSDKTRSTNILNAVKKINNAVLPSGAIFSFNQNVGKRTATAGFKEAHVIVGDELVDGLGGGICQVSSTIFEAVLRADLQIVERANHSLKIGYVPMGGDATVDWGGIDFQFKNNKSCPLRIQLEANGGALTCKIYSSEEIKLGKVEIKIKKTDKKGLKYTLTRKVDGKVNYTAKSVYHEEKKETTTKKDKSKNKDKGTQNDEAEKNEDSSEQ